MPRPIMLQYHTNAKSIAMVRCDRIECIQELFTQYGCDIVTECNVYHCIDSYDTITKLWLKGLEVQFGRPNEIK